MMVDGAGYDVDGVIQSISQKAFALPTLHAAISTLGVGMAGHLFAMQLEGRFTSFDDMIEGIEPAAAGIYAALLEVGVGTITDVTITIIGWSRRDQGPAAYTMRMSEPESEAYIQQRDARHRAEFNDDTGLGVKAFQLQRTDFSTINPPPFRPLNEIGFPHYQFDEDIGEVADPEIDLLHMLEAQRRRKFATRPGCAEAHKIGGLALLSSITANGVYQKVVHRWEEDRLGETIQPVEIADWRAWRAALAPAPPEGMSRLRRQMLERKDRKAAR
ncbi:hypothetical protein [Bradyrhizobium sp. 23]|uniref:hypothetical protein n=1 Tax=Bradyrhizobium sp. 23 TaxID=2782667 RepID=UPI001FF87C18|nr:hypothetical protein [Bradyrhizobium sp. 23]MCK1317148.1 hypothetical protein [Bradyrhizobium sp. 23]